MEGGVLFSVIMPVYNRAWLLVDTVKAVLAQQYQQWELILVDDGSTDDTHSVLTGFTDPRIHVLYQQNAGPCAARNHGAKHAKGQYLVFLDSDDLIRVDFLASFSEFSKANPEKSLIFCQGNFVDKDGRVLEVKKPERFLNFENEAVMLCGTFAVATPLFHEVNGYDEKIRFGENHELGIRLLTSIQKKGEITGRVDKVLIDIRREQSASFGGSDYNRAHSTIYLLKKHQLLFKQKGFRNYLRTNYAIIAYSFLRLRAFNDAFMYLFKAILVSPFYVRNYLRLFYFLSQYIRFKLVS